LIERVATVAGPGVERPANLIVPVGTPVRDVLQPLRAEATRTRW
jgi:electron transport complex protein RnfC